MTFQKHWYLGFLGLIGVFALPKLFGVFQADGTWWDLTSVLWFLWFLYFIPDTNAKTSDDKA